MAPKEQKVEKAGEEAPKKGGGAKKAAKVSKAAFLPARLRTMWYPGSGFGDITSDVMARSLS